jgi:hypothetical protein
VLLLLLVVVVVVQWAWDGLASKNWPSHKSSVFLSPPKPISLLFRSLLHSAIYFLAPDLDIITNNGPEPRAAARRRIKKTKKKEIVHDDFQDTTAKRRSVVKTSPGRATSTTTVLLFFFTWKIKKRSFVSLYNQKIPPLVSINGSPYNKREIVLYALLLLLLLLSTVLSLSTTVDNFFFPFFLFKYSLGAF